MSRGQGLWDEKRASCHGTFGESIAGRVPADFVLSDANIRETERLLPTRNGMTAAHGLWDVRGKPGVLEKLSGRPQCPILVTRLRAQRLAPRVSRIRRRSRAKWAT